MIVLSHHPLVGPQRITTSGTAIGSREREVTCASPVQNVQRMRHRKGSSISLRVVAKGDELQRLIIKYFKRKETQHDIDCI
jgi:hypothetical protein